MGAPVLGSVCVSKTIIPEAQEHLLAYPPCRDTPSIGGFGVRGEQPQKATPLRRADVRVCYRDALAFSYSRRNSSSCQVISARSRKLTW